jgi:hypothetical protein
MSSQIGGSSEINKIMGQMDSLVTNKTQRLGIKTCLDIFEKIGAAIDKSSAISSKMQVKLEDKMQKMLKKANANEVSVNTKTGESMITGEQADLEDKAMAIMLKVHNLQTRSASPTPPSLPVQKQSSVFTFDPSSGQGRTVSSSSPTPPNTPTSTPPNTPPNSPSGSPR